MLRSSIAWIDFSEQDRRHMMEVVSLFKQRDTRDELGLGSIRDAVADLFFPGTTTLQTRARYFLFVPWLYLYYESRRVPSDRVQNRLKGDEIKLIRALQAAGETDGVIGKVSGASLHRFPASIYWNGLRRWGILRYSGSQSQYHRWLDHFYRKQHEQPVTDDHEPIEGWGGGNWDPSLPPVPDGFPDEADFRIRPSEAKHLRERVALSCQHSLLVTLLDRCEPVDDVVFIWMHPQLGEFPSEQQMWIAHARNFSEMMQGAALLYNLMLAELCQQDELVDTYRAMLEDWREDLASHFTELVGWDRKAFWELVTHHGRIPMPTRRFVNAWLDMLLAGGWAPPNLADHQEIGALVRDREIWLKRGRSRFESQRHLEMWSGAAGIAPLDFRWSIARRMTNDILLGLRAGEGSDDART
jgi:hypothetical protein